MDTFEGILFDLDGLLIDSEKEYHRVSYEIADELSVPLHDGILDQQMGRSPVESMEIFRKALSVDHMTSVELVAWRDRLMLEAYSQTVDVMPGALEILKAASAHFKVAIATGSTRNLVEVVVDTLDIGRYLDLILPSDEIKQGKPAPEIYQTAARQLSLTPQQCIVLEDSSNGSMAGHQAGCYVIAIPNEYTRKQDFSFVDALCEDLDDAWQHIQRLRPKT